MKILLVHYRFFISGGPERYLFNIMELLAKRGYNVIPFSVKTSFNRHTVYGDYFLSSIGSGDEVYSGQYSKRNIKLVWKVFTRIIYSFEAKRKLKKLIKREKPDIAYVLQYQNKMSCSVIDEIKANKIPVIHRISDFSLFCITSILYHYQTGKICERCINSGYFQGVIHKCVNSSYLQSFLKMTALYVQDILNIQKKIDYFVIPSRFSIGKYLEYGIPSDKIMHIPTFFNFSNKHCDALAYNDFAVYIGRVDPDKGLLTLIKAFEETDMNLVIIGASSGDYCEYLRDYLLKKQHKIKFTGKLEFPQIAHYLSDCMFTIVPSECYDNFPNSVLESYGFKKPVIATNLGSLPEMVIDNKTGYLFESKNHIELKEKCGYLFNNRDIAKELGENGYHLVENDFSAQQHIEKLTGLFNIARKRYDCK